MDFFKTTPDLYKHQRVTSDFIANNNRVIVTSDPGTGKTRSVLQAYTENKDGKMLVLAPLSILQPSWGDDIENFNPELAYAVAYAKNRAQMFAEDVDITITNHDAVKWLIKNPQYLEGFTWICVDEFTAFKNSTSQRSKALAALINHFEHRVIMSGTPNSNTILDMWHPAKLVDDGERLGKSFWSFRSQVCSPQQVGPDPRMVEWRDKPGAEDAVAGMLKDITVRFAFEECIDVPEHTQRTMYVDLPPKLMKQYQDFAWNSMIDTKEGETINAIHAGAKVKKLLQLCTGAVYNEAGVSKLFHTQRYELVMDLIAARQHSVVAFNWRHERTELCKLADKMKIPYAYIDGTVNVARRTEIVRDYQAGKLQVIFCHPQAAGHGLTLTKGTTTIWCSPSYNAEHFQQMNRRIYRAGQKNRTETIMIAARDTHEVKVYERLNEKMTRMEDLLSLFNQITKAA
jgi:SNF2 family DNA or RNA helicase